MNTFETVVKNHKQCVVFYNEDARRKLTAVATLIALRETVRRLGVHCEIKPLKDRVEFEHISFDDWSKVYCYVDFKGDSANLIYSHYDKEHVYGFTKIGFTHAFPAHDCAAIEEACDHKHAKAIELSHLWVVMKNHPDDMVIKAIVCDRLIQFYHKHQGLADYIIKNSYPNVYSIYLHLIDYAERHRLNLFKKGKKPQSNKKLRLQGSVVTINQESNVDEKYKEFGFQKYPEATFLVNYWNDGVIQVLTNTHTETRHHDLAHTYDVLMEDYQDKFQKKIIPLSTIKWVCQDNTNPLFTLEFESLFDLQAHIFYGTRSTANHVFAQKHVYFVDYEDLTEAQWKDLDSLGLSLYDLLQLTTHKTPDELIISALLLYGKAHRPNKTHKIFSIEKGVKLSSLLKSRLIKKLNEQVPEPLNEASSSDKINEQKSIRDDVLQHIKNKYIGQRYDGKNCSIEIESIKSTDWSIRITYKFYEKVSVVNGEHHFHSQTELYVIQDNIAEEIESLYAIPFISIKWKRGGGETIVQT
jgi:hypothetical protein